LRTDRRRPILTIIEDTSGGMHDSLIAACDRDRYATLGIEGNHDNCADNLRPVLAKLQCRAAMPFSAPKWISSSPFSACPQDVLPINGRACRPLAAHFGDRALAAAKPVAQNQGHRRTAGGSVACA